MKSRVGVKSPTFISRTPLAICVMIVGIMARADWRPQFSLADGLKETIEWFSNPENLAKYKYDIYNR